MTRTLSLILVLLCIGCAESDSNQSQDEIRQETMTDEEAALQADIDALGQSLDSMREEIDQGFEHVDSMQQRLEYEQRAGDSLHQRIEANQREIDAMMGK